MDDAEKDRIIAALSAAFGPVRDITPSPNSPLHVLLAKLKLPPPWQPSPARALAVFEGWPDARPAFYVEEDLVGKDGNPPDGHNSTYLAGETWRGFSFSFNDQKWGHDPVLAVQLWINRFLLET
jgi:hypothetical protein